MDKHTTRPSDRTAQKCCTNRTEFAQEYSLDTGKKSKSANKTQGSQNSDSQSTPGDKK